MGRMLNAFRPFSLLFTLAVFGCKLADKTISGHIGESPSDSLPPVSSHLVELDLTFNGKGFCVYSGSNSSVGASVVIVSSDRILVGGSYNETGGPSSSARIWAYNENGSIASNFAIGGIYNYGTSDKAHGKGLILDSVGNIVMSGYRYSFGNSPTYWLLDPIGTVLYFPVSSSYGQAVEGEGISEDLINGGYYLVGSQDHNYMTISEKSYSLADVASFGGTSKVSFSLIPFSAGKQVVVDASGRAIVVGEE